ncbi:hypothetical protein GCM10009530_53110 [Microbispora corallina]|uniref:Uncharacterized protein n=1 Tax=Microbispora corallina TaxID=83302 RepID=A0ABQ4G368_9ACTN|nr:hypothetical protein [Microbispora corallina]GIH41485.1 hypothetical protein Mco01_44850 [Microbispora corallina]
MRLEPGWRARLTLAGVLAGLFAALGLYQVLEANGLQQTSLFYVGVPAVIAITVALTARARTCTGLIMATITIGLALAGPLLGEGVVCLLMAAPLFYLVGLVVGLAVDWMRRDTGRRNASLVVAPLLLAVALEGATPATSLPREGEVTAVRAVAPGTDVEAALAGSPRFGPVTSPFLRLGFPRPVRSEGLGLAAGDARTVVFTPRRSLGIGAPLEPRSMTLRVVSRGPGLAVFGVERDTTLARWLDLHAAEFRWGDGRLEVTLRYRRTFDPGWYFGPLQRYALSEAAGYLAAAFVP